jgi:hypothetical protein
VALLEIQKPTADQEEKLKSGTVGYRKMMETIKPFAKGKSYIQRGSNSEWQSCD